MTENLTKREKDFILEMMDFISDMPTMFEPLENRMKKHGVDEESFYEMKEDLKAKLI